MRCFFDGTAKIKFGKRHNSVIIEARARYPGCLMREIGERSASAANKSTNENILIRQLAARLMDVPVSPSPLASSTTPFRTCLAGVEAPRRPFRAKPKTAYGHVHRVVCKAVKSVDTVRFLGSARMRMSVQLCHARYSPLVRSGNAQGKPTMQ